MSNFFEKKTVDGFTLKMIAVCTMFIDHFGAVVVERLLMAGYMGTSEWAAANIYVLSTGYFVLRAIGRLAFPIYCYLIVEGLMHTRSIPKYLLRLGIFALISEIPFDMAFNQTLANGSVTQIVEWGYNNVFLTLFLGLLATAAMKLIDDNMHWKGSAEEIGSFKYKLFGLGKLLWKMLILFAAMALAEVVFHTDYGASGIAAIGIMYLLYKRPRLAMISAVVILSLMASELEAVALIDVIFIAKYSGERGKNSPALKYFFYVFYPAHLLLLEGIAMLLGYK